MVIDRWMNKEEAVYREMEYDSAIKAWHSSTCSNMEGTRAHHTNGRKPEREGQTRYNPAIKAWHNSVCSNMDRTRAHHTNGRKPERERQMRYDSYVGSKTQHQGTYLQNRHRLAEIESRCVVCKGEGGQGGIDGQPGISGCKLVYIEWINKALLYIQHRELHAISCNKPQWNNIYIFESLCCIAKCTEINTTL